MCVRWHGTGTGIVTGTTVTVTTITVTTITVTGTTVTVTTITVTVTTITVTVTTTTVTVTADTGTVAVVVASSTTYHACFILKHKKSFTFKGTSTDGLFLFHFYFGTHRLLHIKMYRCFLVV